MLRKVVSIHELHCPDKRKLAALRSAVAGTRTLSAEDVIRSLTCAELRRVCTNSGAASSGNKSQLVAVILNRTNGSDVRVSRRASTKERAPIAARSQTSRFVAIDFETANVSRDSACAVSLVVSDGKRILETYSSLIRPPTLTFQFSYIHGITAKDVKTAPSYGDIHDEILQRLDGAAFIAAHNASFDRSVMRALCRYWDVREPSQPWNCTVKLARDTWGIFPTKLPDVCRHLGIGLKHHEALSDAKACAQIVLSAHGHSTAGSGTGRVRRRA
jgi:DNA polymerase-3 subunit epsilon